MNDQLPDCTPSDPAMAERWRRTLDAMGTHIVRTRLKVPGRERATRYDIGVARNHQLYRGDQSARVYQLVGRSQQGACRGPPTMAAERIAIRETLFHAS